MAFVDRTAYPWLPSMVSVREPAEAFTPTADEVSWACAKVLGPGSRLALLVMLKCYQRLGYFPQLERVPPEVVEYVCAQAVQVVEEGVGPLGRQGSACGSPILRWWSAGGPLWCGWPGWALAWLGR
jgi:hypothetical protein